MAVLIPQITNPRNTEGVMNLADLARKDVKRNAQTWMPAPAASQISIMNTSQTTIGHIPAPKANRTPSIPSVSCAIFRNVTTLLNASSAEQIAKDQKSNNPSAARCGLG